MKFRITQPFAGSVVFDVEGATKEDVIRQGSSRLARLHLLFVLAPEQPVEGEGEGIVLCRPLAGKKGFFVVSGSPIGGVGAVRVASLADRPEFEIVDEADAGQK